MKFYELIFIQPNINIIYIMYNSQLLLEFFNYDLIEFILVTMFITVFSVLNFHFLFLFCFQLSMSEVMGIY